VTLTEACIRKPVFAWMLMAATVLFGALAVSRIGISQYPDVDFPTININATWEGAAPEAMEKDVVEFIEESVTQVEGVRSIMSSSRQGGANITVELDLERDVDLALQDVTTRVSQARQRLPRDIDEPVISKSNPEDQPIMWVGLSGPYSQQMVADTARYRVKERLQTVPGVGEVMLGGYLERNVRIWLDVDRMDAQNIAVTDVMAALRSEHVELPAGNLDAAGRQVSIRVMGEALDLATLEKIVVREIDDQPVYLSDVALVEDGFEDVRRRARVGGLPTQGMGVKKQRGANAVEVAKGVKAVMAEIQKTLPEGMELGINFDATRFIEESVEEVEFELLLAIGLTALVCWMFLGSLSSTLNVILAIPMSLLGTVAVIWSLGYTLNTFTLLGLTLAVGIVVDDAIMVMENIHRHAEMGKDRVRAAREGTAEITFAALAASAAVVAIFLPVVFMEGIIGKYFMQFGVTLCVAVAFSYIEAVTLAPARCAQILDVTRAHRSRLGRLVDDTFERMGRGYGWLLARALRRPLVVLALAIVTVALSLQALFSLPREFVPSQDQGRLIIRLQTAVGSSLEETDAVFKPAEAILDSRPEVARALSIIGGFGGGANTVIVFVMLVPPEQRMSQADFSQVLRGQLNAIPGLRAVVQDPSQQGFTAQRGFPIEFSVRGSDWDTLVQAADTMKDKLAASGLAVDVDSDYQVGQPELRITPDRAKAADVGVSVEDIATTINALVGGNRVGKYSTGGRRVDVRVRLLASQRSSPEDISRLRVRSAGGELLPLSMLVTQVERPTLQAITRMDRERAITIYANPAPGGSQEEALAYVEQLAKELPVGYRAVLGGASVAFKDSTSSLLFAFILGALVAYMVLASQFNSFRHPVTVLSILPLAIAGAAWALTLGDKTLNIFSMIGLLLLMGIVKKNSIILVDYATQMRNSGLDAGEAMLRAGPTRLRPILMTSIATMMAAVPSALALGPGGEVRAPMAMAVIGGLIVSTLLSLFVVPAFYMLMERVPASVRRRLGRLGPEQPQHQQGEQAPAGDQNQPNRE
jgi:hydrophobe/amphiphile efflux-1 (HAE1) family protein